MDPFEHIKGHNSQFQSKERVSVTGPQAKDGWKKMGCEEKKAAVQEEMTRMHKLPTNSTYATHRLRVLNKILQLLSVQVNLEFVYKKVRIYRAVPFPYLENHITGGGVGVAFCWAFSLNRNPDCPGNEYTAWIILYPKKPGQKLHANFI